MTLRLLFVRHGLSSFNLEHRIQGRNDLSTLTAQGQQQAKKTGQALAKVPIDAVYSSPLQRAAFTTTKLLEQVSTKLDPIFDEDLLEVDLEPWSGLAVNEVKEQFSEAYLIWKKNPKDLILHRKDGSKYKPIQELMNQAQVFVKKLIENHKPEGSETILVVAHNAILRCLILSLLGDPIKGFRRIQLDNASLSIFNLAPHPKKNYQIQVECLNNTTHLNPPLPPKGKHARVILVRHGETDWNLQSRFQGQIDIPLNENGKSQARAAGSFLSKLRIDRAFSSSMSRPIQTAEQILEQNIKKSSNLEIALKEGLIEIGHGLWEGKLESEINQDWSDLLEEWKISPEKVQMPEGETIQDVWDRSIECWKGICKSIQSHETALVVAHDAVNKTILCNLLGLTPGDIWMVKQGNGGVTIVDISQDPSQPDLVTCLNLTSHLGGVLDNTAAGAL